MKKYVISFCQLTDIARFIGCDRTFNHILFMSEILYT